MSTMRLFFLQNHTQTKGASRHHGGAATGKLGTKPVIRSHIRNRVASRPDFAATKRGSNWVQGSALLQDVGGDVVDTPRD